MEASTKQCRRCEQWFDRVAFNNDKRRPDGKYPYCKSCCAEVKRRLAKKWGSVWRERKRADYQRNPAKAKAAAKEYRRLHPEKVKAWLAAYARRHPEKVTERALRHNARKREASIVPFTREQLEQKLAMWGAECWMCGLPAKQIDHVKPLAKGGPHILANLRPACGRCNVRKAAHWPVRTRPHEELWLRSQITKLGTAQWVENTPMNASYFRDRSSHLDIRLHPAT